MLRWLALVLVALPLEARALTIVLDFEDEPLGPISSAWSPFGEITFSGAAIGELGGSKALLPFPDFELTAINLPKPADQVIADVLNPTAASFTLYWFLWPEEQDYGQETPSPLVTLIYDQQGNDQIFALHPVVGFFDLEPVLVPWGLDNLTITAIPEPSSLWLGLLGLGLLGGAKPWRQGRSRHLALPPSATSPTMLPEAAAGAPLLRASPLRRA